MTRYLPRNNTNGLGLEINTSKDLINKIKGKVRLLDIKMGLKLDDRYKAFVELITLKSVLQVLH